MMVGDQPTDPPGVDSMDRTLLRPLFDWGHCQACMMVSEGWDVSARSSERCPQCHEQGFGADWPPEPARLLLRQAFHREADDQDEFAVKAFLVAEAVDAILAWVLRAAVDYLSTESLDVARYIDVVGAPGLSTEQRLDILKKVTDIRLSQVAELREEPDFTAAWKDLRARRDRFLHAQDLLAFDGLAETDLAETARMAVKVFAHVNNMVW
jgi:hypothetical protein